jgi:hypothetical protein
MDSPIDFPVDFIMVDDEFSFKDIIEQMQFNEKEMKTQIRELEERLSSVERSISYQSKEEHPILVKPPSWREECLKQKLAYLKNMTNNAWKETSFCCFKICST